MLLRVGDTVMASSLWLPQFEALMLGVVIGGSPTVIGSSANLVAAEVARQRGAWLGFRTWLSYPLPTVMLQLLVAWLWCWHFGH